MCVGKMIFLGRKGSITKVFVVKEKKRSVEAKRKTAALNQGIVEERNLDKGICFN